MPLAIKLVRDVTYHDKVPPIKNMTFQSRGLLRSRDKLKSFYLYYQSTYGYQTWQNGNLLTR